MKLELPIHGQPCDIARYILCHLPAPGMCIVDYKKAGTVRNYLSLDMRNSGRVYLTSRQPDGMYVVRIK